MSTLGVVLPYLFGLLVVISVTVGSLRFSRRRRMGPALFTYTDSSRWWLAGVWLLLSLGSVVGYVSDESIGPVLLRVGMYSAAGFFGWFSRGFSVHEEGIVFGMTAMYWSELEGWSWDSGKRTLLVWSRSWWVRGMALRPLNGLNTGQAKSVELEALLERFAGGVKRSL